MKNALLLFLIMGFPTQFFAQTDLEKALFDLPDVRFEKIDIPEGFSAAYVLNVRQPIDHKDVSKGYFYQRVWFCHRGFKQPTVINTAGYHCPSNRIYEMTELLDANQLRVEHRFFGTSMPESLDYQYLNMEQATADLHRVRELFGNLYKGKWISTGISKGGMTTIYYKYFYPDDIDVAVPYVAPVDTTFEDPRIYTFLRKQGTKKCRKAIRAVQDKLLNNREDVLVRLKWYEKGKAHTFDYLGFETAFEYAVLEYPFSFWQSGHKCADIPSKNTSIDGVLDYFNKTVGLSLFSDQEIKTYGSHYYQAATQTGYYGYETKPFKGQLKASPERPHAALVPNKMPVSYDKTLSNKLFNWTQTKGDDMVYIYGKTDTWTAAGVPVSKKVDSEWFLMEGKSHSDARIKNMTSEERTRLIDFLEKELEMEIE